MKMHIHSLTADGADGTAEIQTLPWQSRKQSSHTTFCFWTGFEPVFADQSVGKSKFVMLEKPYTNVHFNCLCLYR